MNELSTAHYSSHFSRNREKDGSLPSDADLLAATQETQGANDFSEEVTAPGWPQSPRVVLGRYNSTAHLHAAES